MKLSIAKYRRKFKYVDTIAYVVCSVVDTMLDDAGMGMGDMDDETVTLDTRLRVLERRMVVLPYLDRVIRAQVNQERDNMTRNVKMEVTGTLYEVGKHHTV